MATTTRFVCAVDFGTTFTSVAFAHSESPNDVKLVCEWPSITGSSDQQVPTEILYLPLPGPVQGSARPRKKKWGYEIQAPETPLRWFKLLLQENSPSISTHEHRPLEGLFTSLLLSYNDSRRSSSNSQRARRGSRTSSGSFSSPQDTEEFVAPEITPASEAADELDRLGIEPVQAVADFLEEVRKLTMEVMIRTYKAEFVKTSAIEYVLTVPAIWSDAAKDYMIRAAKKAGYGNHRKDFNLVSEPEAAAAYSLQSMRHMLSEGDIFVVCDAGGGTVDLISYEITNLIPTLSISEVVSGTGELCGSAYIDKRFQAYIRQLLGEATINNLSIRSNQTIKRTWEEGVKFKFGDPNAREFELSVHGVPDDEDKHVEDGYHIMKTKDVKDIFDPVVNKILKLVGKQVENAQTGGKKVAAIILVGGFGCSEYLLKALKLSNHPIEVLQPPNPRTAIVRGALLRGLDGSIVKEQRARRHYCYTASTTYKPGKGQEYDDHRFWSDATDEWRVQDRVHYFIGKGMVVDDTFSKPLGFCREIPTTDFNSKTTYPATMKLLACDIDEAPEYKWEAPRAMYHVCSVQVDLKEFPIDKAKLFANKAGKQYYRFSYNMKLSVQEEVTTFEVLSHGKSYGLAVTRFK